MELEVGKLYLCIKDVVMNIGGIRYHRGRCYKCEVTGCITNEDGDATHHWGSVEKIMEYFTEAQKHRSKTIKSIIGDG